MTKKILIKYRGCLIPLNKKDAPSASGKLMKVRPSSCKYCKAFLYTTEDYKNAKLEIQWKIKQHVEAQTKLMGGMFSKSDGPLYANMIIYWKNTADVDAFNKIILDALSGLAYVDDRLIKKSTVEIKERQLESGFDLVISQINPQPTLF